MLKDILNLKVFVFTVNAVAGLTYEISFFAVFSVANNSDLGEFVVLV